jgi:hypothetical protein
MADKYIRNASGLLTETEATVTSAGGANAGDIPALDGTGRLDTSLMPVGVSAEVAIVLASENLAAGDFVNIYDDAGTAKCRKADASTSGKRASGFVLSAVTSGQNATVFAPSNANTQVTGATPGDVYLSATVPGGFTSTPPSAAGQIVQLLGVATSATSIMFSPAQPIVLA